MRKTAIKIIILCLFFVPFLSQAFQLYITPGSDISVSATPSNPGPYQDVTIKIQSYTYDLDHSLISWVKDNKQSTAGNGLKTFTFKTSSAGTPVIIGIMINSRTGDKPVKAILTFLPVEVELLWQANTYVPYWYKGKAQPSAETEIMVSAIARINDFQGKEISDQSLVYNWKKDGDILPNSSGVGKSALVFKADTKGTTHKIEVIVSTPNKNITGTASTEIKVGDPKIIFYNDKPLIGTAWQQSLNKETLLDGQMILRAEPFFFSNKNILNFNWYLNGTPVSSNENNPARLYLKTTNKNVSSRINLQISNPNKILQNTSNSLIIRSISGGII